MLAPPPRGNPGSATVYVLILCANIVYFYVHILLLARKQVRQINSIMIQVAPRPCADQAGSRCGSRGAPGAPP